ncbi:MAG: hypothetical protein QOF26_1200 [Baekduia sp.]|jgi:hypothetical protein|nr:hypothetical protein [Baekduia sp.]
MIDGVTIRHAFPDDAEAVARLAALDSRRVPAGPLLLAEVAGVPWAAVALVTGATIADPFRPTAELVDLLHRRAAQLAPPASGAAGRRVRGAARLTRHPAAPAAISRAVRPALRRAPAR